MTMILAHPAAEDLGAFVEGTLNDAERSAVVEHIADCDECRIVVVDATAFGEETAAAHGVSGRWWWLANAAAVLLVVALGSFTHHEYRARAEGRALNLVQDATRFASDLSETTIREWGGLRALFRLFNQLDPIGDRLSPFSKAYGKVKSRPFEARFSGLPFVPRSVMRGESDSDDLGISIMKAAAADAAELRGDGAGALHTRGIGLMFSDRANEALTQLEAAAAKEPKNSRYQSDVAAALITMGHADRALAVCDRALVVDPSSPDALFNRAKALELLGQQADAINAYQRYLAVDPSSGWAGEVRQRLRSLQE